MRSLLFLAAQVLCAVTVLGAFIDSEAVDKELSVAAHRSEVALPTRHDRDVRPGSWTPRLICDGFRNLTKYIHEIDEKVAALNEADCSCWKEEGDHDMSKWQALKEDLFELEVAMDVFDVYIDSAPAFKCFTCDEEEKIVKCRERYVCALIDLLESINRARESAYWRADKIISIAVQSLRDSDTSFIYELARRMQCREWMVFLMQMQGAADGSTPGSLQEQFSKFPAIPYINGENFGEYAQAGDKTYSPTDCDGPNGNKCPACCNSWAYRGKCPWAPNVREPHCHLN